MNLLLVCWCVCTNAQALDKYINSNINLAIRFATICPMNNVHTSAKGKNKPTISRWKCWTHCQQCNKHTTTAKYWCIEAENIPRNRAFSFVEYPIKFVLRLAFSPHYFGYSKEPSMTAFRTDTGQLGLCGFVMNAFESIIVCFESGRRRSCIELHGILV